MTFNPAQLERRLTEYRNAPLAALLPAFYVLPRYDGRSIANLPATIGALLGVEVGWVEPRLDDELWVDLADGVERVLFLLVDGIGWRRLWEMVAQRDRAFPQLLEEWGAHVAPITSVSPATTSVATTTVWGNGAAPAEHGMLGFSFLLMEQAAVCNLLFWKPLGRESGGHGELETWGLKPETFLPTPSIAQVLAQGGVETRALMPAQIANSPLSRMQMRGAKVEGYGNATDLWLMMHRWLEETAGQRGYCYAYYPDFDVFSHRDGPNHRSWEALWHAFRFHLSSFLDTLPTEARRKTILLISADHGHVYSPLARRVLPRSHPELTRHFMLMPGGEPRHSYLYVRPDHHDAIRNYHQQHLAEDFHLLDAAEALHAGLYGPPDRLHPDAERRLGDFAMLSKGGAMFWILSPDKMYFGMHGSLEPEEMVVPFIALRLDKT
ncbi:MAG: alkaline phosphatase family protein [Chloroflexota bacterium]|nr:alkaline phosphatase family protein [Chloroflexota bacterium]